MTEVRVSHIYDTDTKEHVYRVQIKSKQRPMLLSFFDVPHNAPRLEHQIQIAAGAAAEDQNEKYHDRHDPDECAKQALAAFKDLKKHPTEQQVSSIQ